MSTFRQQHKFMYAFDHHHHHQNNELHSSTVQAVHSRYTLKINLSYIYIVHKHEKSSREDRAAREVHANRYRIL